MGFKTDSEISFIAVSKKNWDLNPKQNSNKKYLFAFLQHILTFKIMKQSMFVSDYHT